MQDFMFNSESVTEGHPDKLCDQISDAVIDHFLAQDPCARVRVECAVAGAIVFIAARFASIANIDFSRIARKVIMEIGYDRPDFNARTCSILTSPQALPTDGECQFDEMELTEAQIDAVRVQHQVTVFGYASDQTPELMPLPISLARRLARRLDDVRHQKMLSYLMPDNKVQVGVEFKNRCPRRIHSVTITAEQRLADEPGLRRLRDDIIATIIEPVFADEPLAPDRKTRIMVNPDGIFLGGPTRHSGLTGRKNAVDTYGEYARLSEKALSGKDMLRIDRIGAYAARHAAKNVVAAGLADECEVMLSYSIGLTQPVSLQVQTFGTGKKSDDHLAELISASFDFRLAGILKKFRLRHLPAAHPEGFYRRLAAYGHVGRTDIDLPWEHTDEVDTLRS
ncbi:MAG: methionine adenosyltransferase [Desulfobacterales bacterium]